MDNARKKVAPDRGFISSIPATVDELTQRNVAIIAELDAATQAKRTPTDRIVDQIVGLCGQIAFVWLHVVWFSLWIALNLSHVILIDPYPFNLLSLVVGLEAIFLATFILIGQNRQSRLSERRSHLDLRINLLSEQENTQILSMLLVIQRHLGIHEGDLATSLLLEAAAPAKIVSQIDDVVQQED